MTPSTLKYLHLNNNPETHFFDNKSMKFFGDTMGNYRVPAKTVNIKRYDDTIVECHALERKRAVNYGLQSTHYFAVDGYALVKGELV